MLQAGFPRDCNDELRTAFRADVIGPEMWTFAGRSKGLRTGRGDAYLDAQLPSRMHVPLQPGLSGELYVVHGTELRDVLGVELDCDGRPLVLTAVGNVWTPAFCRTRYRSDACECDGEPVELGDTVYVECKCITTNNVFVAEGVLRNAGARQHTYRIGFRTHPTLPVAPGVFRFGTVAMCKKGGKSAWYE